MNNVEPNFSSVYLKVFFWMFLNIRRKIPVPVSFLLNVIAVLQLKPIFIQKEVPALVFSWQFSETIFLKSTAISKKA